MAGAFRAHEFGRQAEPWEILAEHRLIEVLWLEPDEAQESAKPGVPL
ncbi:hypothetical protein JOF53_002673 [Crossiella equi]|uniref:Uncharacterized protein n=1 Tax=Crossiella equi TaxID=130796 RepID=A0ABS5AB53_9PSEU|nr:hypothetical protein [Crossiella equi]MBP2473801.1 hypothetical protein [Crossiella equi]